MKQKTLPGINIQWPWSRLLLSGKKTIETRSYPLPKKFEGVELAVIETPGPFGKKAGILRAHIVGTIIFEASFQYRSWKHWEADKNRHCVEADDPLYRWTPGRKKFGWVVRAHQKLNKSVKAPSKRGIIFSSSCKL